MAFLSEQSATLTRENLIGELKELEPNDFTSRYVLDRVPWLFTDRNQYIEWKTSLAAELEIDPFMIIVVGSAGLGFSLSPSKEFSPFGPRSDVDVAVVSQRHFDEAWRWLREAGSGDLMARSKIERDMFRWHRRNLIFDGAIATDQILPMLPFNSQWAAGLGHASSREPTTGRPIKVRVYRDFESLRMYHVANIRALKLKLLLADSDSPPDQLRGLDSREENTRMDTT